MKNNTNIYDIDGELIRKADDLHKFTLDELRKKIDYYDSKLKEVPEGSTKYYAYLTYKRNLAQYIFQNHINEIVEEYTKERQNKSVNEQVEEAIKELEKEVNNDGETKEDTSNEVPNGDTGDNTSSTNGESGDVEAIERPISDIHEETGGSKGDLLVERDNVNTVMDEYVDFEEVTE